MRKYQATFRFYEELNDFLPPEKQKIAFNYSFSNHPAIKDAIEAIGIPHVEVDLILANSKPVDFNYQLQNGDSISVYPIFESFDISPVSKLRNKPLRNPTFILDVHLGKLVKYLRLLGLDSYYDNTLQDRQIIEKSINQQRIILTRDINLLKHKVVTHGYWVRSTKPETQITEVIKRFSLESIFNPFSRCIKCNGHLKKINKAKILDVLPPLIKRDMNEFYQCQDCAKVYWKGTHYQKLLEIVKSLTK